MKASTSARKLAKSLRESAKHEGDRKAKRALLDEAKNQESIAETLQQMGQ